MCRSGSLPLPIFNFFLSSPGSILIQLHTANKEKREGGGRTHAHPPLLLTSMFSLRPTVHYYVVIKQWVILMEAEMMCELCVDTIRRLSHYGLCGM